MSDDTKTVKELLTEMRVYAMGRSAGMRYVDDWKSHIPQDSRWHPGDPGDPSCKICDGMGWVRLDLPINHPEFGKMFLCSCVSQDIVIKAKKEDEDRRSKTGRK